MLENTNKIAGANKKKMKETITLPSENQTFILILEKVWLDTALKTHCLFPNETPLPAIHKMVIIKQAKFETDVKENKDLNGWKKFDEK